jgi:hypothetical protein
MKWSSRVRREAAINARRPYFTNSIRAIDKSQVSAWAASRNKTASARTFNIERETLIQIPDYALREGLALENPACGPLDDFFCAAGAGTIDGRALR